MLKTKFKFKKSHRDSRTDIQPWTLKTIFVNCTKNCNFKCFYCYSRCDNPKQMPITLVEKIVKECKKNNVENFILTGGEPLLHKDFNEILKLAREAELTIKIATNGFYLDKDCIQLLNKYNVASLQISLDSLNKNHFNKIKNLPGNVLDVILQNIENVLEIKKFHIAISSVITRINSNDLIELMDYCHNIGVDTFTAYKPIPINTKINFRDFYLSDSEYIKLLDQLIEKFRTLDNAWIVEMGYPWVYDSNIVRKWMNLVEMNLTGCIAGKNSVTVLVNGFVTPCVCLEIDDFYIGDMSKKSFEEIWDSKEIRLFRSTEIHNNCVGCKIFNLCNGGCRALAFCEHGKNDAPDQTCKFWRIPHS